MTVRELREVADDCWFVLTEYNTIDDDDGIWENDEKDKELFNSKLDKEVVYFGPMDSDIPDMNFIWVEYRE